MTRESASRRQSPSSAPPSPILDAIRTEDPPSPSPASRRSHHLFIGLPSTEGAAGDDRLEGNFLQLTPGPRPSRSNAPPAISPTAQRALTSADGSPVRRSPRIAALEQISAASRAGNAQGKCTKARGSSDHQSKQTKGSSAKRTKDRVKGKEIRMRPSEANARQSAFALGNGSRALNAQPGFRHSAEPQPFSDPLPPLMQNRLPLQEIPLWLANSRGEMIRRNSPYVNTLSSSGNGSLADGQNSDPAAQQPRTSRVFSSPPQVSPRQRQSPVTGRSPTTLGERLGITLGRASPAHRAASIASSSRVTLEQAYQIEESTSTSADTSLSSNTSVPSLSHSPHTSFDSSVRTISPRNYASLSAPREEINMHSTPVRVGVKRPRNENGVDDELLGDGELDDPESEDKENTMSPSPSRSSSNSRPSPSPLVRLDLTPSPARLRRSSSGSSPLRQSTLARPVPESAPIERSPLPTMHEEKADTATQSPRIEGHDHPLL